MCYYEALWCVEAPRFEDKESFMMTVLPEPWFAKPKFLTMLLELLLNAEGCNRFAVRLVFSGLKFIEVY